MLNITTVSGNINSAEVTVHKIAIVSWSAVGYADSFLNLPLYIDTH